jgi:hypothetical protein
VLPRVLTPELGAGRGREEAWVVANLGKAKGVA